jgi:phage-related protein
MAKKSGELNKPNEIDATSIAVTKKRDSYLEERASDYSLENTETLDSETATDDATAETEQIRGQIEETRRGMSETIDAIQEKMSFSTISEQVKDEVSEQIGSALHSVKDAVSEEIGSAVLSVKDAAMEKVGDFMQVFNKGINEIGKLGIAKTAKENPMILSLVGLGVGALLVNRLMGKKKKRSSNRYDYRYNSDDNYRYNSDDDADDVRYSSNYRRGLKSGRSEESNFETTETTRNKLGGAANSAYDSVSSAAGTAYEGVSDVAGATYEGVSSAAGAAYEGVGSAASKTYKGIGNAAGFAYDKAGDLGEQVKESYDYYIEENPLAVGAVALAVGSALGFAIPLTEAENEYMGEMRDNFFEKAQTTAQDAIGTVKQMAGDAQKTIVDEVKNKVDEAKNQTA